MSKGKQEMTDTIKLRGCIEGHLRDAEGNPLAYFRANNTVVTSGRAWVLNRIASNDANSIIQIAVGTGTTAPATGDTALGSEFLRKAIGTMTLAGTTANPPYFQAQVSYATNEATTTLGEAGLFNSSSSGTMLSRVTFTTINKTTSNTLTISYTVSN